MNETTHEAEALSPHEPCLIKTRLFEGPLDLLLHLIRLEEVDVTDIPIARIAEQYLEYLDLMRELNLDVAGEYLLMAATLAWIKSRLLLPAEPGADAGDAAGDPRAELVARLLEYQRFREAARDLDALPRLGRDAFHAGAAGPEAPGLEEAEVEVGLLELVEAFRRVIEKAPARLRPHELEVETITVRERMLAVMDLLARTDSAEFDQLFAGPDGVIARTRALVVATFLALLELARLSALRIYQGLRDDGSPAGPIRVRRAEEGGETDWSQRVAELM
jgi:segregation and condensation protein A